MPRRLLLKRLMLSLTTVVAVLVALGLAESGARVVNADACERAARALPTVEQSLQFLAPCIREEGISTLLPGDGAPMTASRHPVPGVHRIAVIGESSGYLLGEMLQAAVRQWPTGRVEILNCAQPASSLEHVERRFDEVMRYHPDTVLLVFGNNLLFTFPQDEERLTLAKWHASSCLLTTLSPAPNEVVLAAASLESRLTLYEAFLKRVAAETKAHQIAFTVSTITGNLRTAPHTVPLSESEARRLVTARVREATGDRAGARDLLSREPLESNPALTRFLLGEWALLDGDGDAARSLLRGAAESDPLQMRASPLTNELVRRLGATLPFTLRDTARFVEEAGTFRIAGWESFEDNCHLRPAVRAREAQEILLSLPLNPPANDPSFPVGFASAWTSGPQIAGLLEGFSRVIGQSQPDYLLQWYLSIPGMVSHWSTAAPQETREAIETFLKEKLETRLAPGASRDRFLIALAEGYWRARLPDEARRLGALTDHSDDARTWVERGLLWLHLGQRAEASAAFDKAVALNPASHELQLYAEMLKSLPAR